MSALVLAAAVLLAGCDKDKGNTGATDDDPDPGFVAPCTKDTKMDHYSTKDSPPIVHTDSPGYQGPLAPRDDPEYTVNPPSGGDHLSLAVPPGTYQGDRVPADGNLMHSLEHGYVIIWYTPKLSERELGVLDGVRRKFARDTLVVERAGMDWPVVATAWGHRLLCDGVNTGEMTSFVQGFRNQAPEKIPH
jgi:hypothetical protein